MYMHTTTLEGGIALHGYKHSETRRYVLLDDDANAWEDIDHGRFRCMRHSDAIEQAFPAYWVLVHATDKDREALKEAFDAAHERGNGDEGAGAHILPRPHRRVRSARSPEPLAIVARKFREVRVALRDAGWVRVRTHGSHEIWRSTDGRRTVTVAGKDSDSVPPGTLAAMRRATGLDDLR